jgi:WD40 repeat protein
VLDLKSGKKLRKFSSGHGATVTALSFTQDGQYLVSGARGSRYATAIYGVVVQHHSADCCMHYPQCVKQQSQLYLHYGYVVSVQLVALQDTRQVAMIAIATFLWSSNLQR